MQTHEVDFAILGGGIAGLASAIGLKKIGVEASVFEAAPSFRPLGAGIVLAANAIKALHYLGIKEQVEAVGRPLEQMLILNQRGKTLVDSPITAEAGKWKGHKFHRGDLHQVLLEQLSAGQVQFGKRLASLSREGEYYLLQFEDGHIVRAKYLIAADGIHSKARQFVLPKSEIRYAGYTCWRGIANKANIDMRVSSETWGTKGRFGIVPLKGERVYWFAVVNALQHSAWASGWTLQDIATHFSDYHKEVKEVLQKTPPGEVLWNDIIDLKPIPKYAFEQLVLIGDAAHATTPNMGQGACMAIEDAAVLIHCLEQSVDVATAFECFEEKRLARTRFVVNASWRLGKIAQNQHPVIGAVRNILIGMVPKRITPKRMAEIFSFEL